MRSKLRKPSLDYEYPLHSHGAPYQKNDRCPPPPQTLPDRACEVPGCRSDSECERHKRCCYNGCIYACLDSFWIGWYSLNHVGWVEMAGYLTDQKKFYKDDCVLPIGRSFHLPISWASAGEGCDWLEMSHYKLANGSPELYT
ncbi:UNVERIFIED_CONTAM: WAP four-disulfide core domain protein 1 [Gekko kuhli]